MIYRFTIAILLALSSISYHTQASDVSPYTSLEKVGKNLFNRIASSQNEIKNNKKYINIIIKEELMPFIDYKYVAYRILGKNLRKVTKSQRMEFVSAIRVHLSSTYANALMNYKNQKVVFEKPKSTKGKRIIGVNVKIIEMNKPTIKVVFKLRKNKKTKEWKAYDMVVEGISLLSSKEAELSKRISKHGIDKVSIAIKE